MTQISKYLVSGKVYDRIFDLFLEVFSKLKSKEEVLTFFNEFLSPTEKIMLTKRLAISLLLAKGFDYDEISDVLKVSSATIGGVSIQYKYGTSLKKITGELIYKEEIKDFWLEIAEALTSMGTVGKKGTSGWKYLNTKIKKELFDKPF